MGACNPQLIGTWVRTEAPMSPVAGPPVAGPPYLPASPRTKQQPHHTRREGVTGVAHRDGWGWSG